MAEKQYASNAERQKAYRERRKATGDKKELRVILNKETMEILERLVRHEPIPGSIPLGNSVGAVIASLARKAEAAATRRMLQAKLDVYFEGYDVE